MNARKWLQKAERNARRAAAKANNAARRQPKKANRDPFYSSKEWKQARYDALRLADGRCQLCGVTPEMGAVLNVDHIKPKHKYPALALSVHNLQVLCGSCNAGKGARDTSDWRLARNLDVVLDLEYLAIARSSGWLP